MKKFLLFVSLGFLSCILKAAPLVLEAPIKEAGTATSVVISSSAFAKVPSSQTSGRTGVYVSNLSSHNVYGLLGNCTSTSAGTSTQLVYLPVSTSTIVGSWFRFFPVREDVCLWLINDSAARSVNVTYQEIKQ